MATVSTVLRTDRINKKGEAPINFFVIKDRKLTKISTGIMVNPKFWDDKKARIKKGVKNSARLNSFLSNKFSELQDKVYEHETLNKSLTTRQLKNKIYGNKPSDFFRFADQACELYLQAGKIGTHDKNKSVINKVRDFCKSEELMFQDITVDWLNKYENFCRKEYGNKTNTIHKDFKFIRKLFNDAYRQDIIEHDQIPFLKFQMKTEKTQRTFLTEAELKSMEDLKPVSGSRMELHRDMFVFAANAGGLRVSDVLQLQWKNYDGVHILFTIKKTGQQLSIKLPTRAIEIVQKLKPKKANPEGFIFPMLPEGLDLKNARLLDAQISSATAYINKNLKVIAKKAEINKNISFHISRHTWATRAIRKGISIDKVSKLMGHAAIRETQIYAKIVNEELDKAMDVFNV